MVREKQSSCSQSGKKRRKKETSLMTYQERCQQGLLLVWQGLVHMGKTPPGNFFFKKNQAKAA